VSAGTRSTHTGILESKVRLKNTTNGNPRYKFFVSNGAGWIKTEPDSGLVDQLQNIPGGSTVQVEIRSTFSGRWLAGITVLKERA
jgi:hypothetical protein